MSLDLGETLLQLDQVARHADGRQADRRVRLAALLEAARTVSASDAVEKTQYKADRPFLAAQVSDTLVGAYAPTEPPPGWRVAAVDGSHIDVDRHLPIACYLMNFGGCVLTYGARPEAQLFSQPKLASSDSDLYLTDPANSAHEESITGALLGLVRTVRELARLVEVVREAPAELPTLALVDGSLVLWGLSGRAYQPFVRDAIIGELLSSLKQLRELASRGNVTLAAYVSLPRSAEVVNAVRCCLCPHDLSRCRESCGHRRSVLAPCSAAADILDRDLFQQVLPAGWRSPVYLTNSSVPREHYGEHQVYFYYLNTGEEMARVEVPQWVALDEKLLALGHSLILDQCRRGQGYPVAISESHEQAVIRGPERRLFKEMVSQALERQGLPSYTSEKERSKRTPWV
ncbi:MAG: DNA double-strand break repair nuclease NurA [Dehalococcoidia bacterium]|nr:DNA double-strand break repair nuclease NurA [Dehalococcoidia bacterium]MSQ16187.1 DNA double-strand break repair nuclease NurA [Dehalococcoidia bacterium]